MEGNIQHVVKQVSKFDGKNANDFLEWSSKLRISLSLYSKPIFEIVQGCSDHQTWTTIRRPLARVGMMPIIICLVFSSPRHPAQLSLWCGDLKEKHERTE